MTKGAENFPSLGAFSTYRRNNKLVLLASFVLLISSVFMVLHSSVQRSPKSMTPVRVVSDLLVTHTSTTHKNGTIYKEVCDQFQPRHTILVIVRTFFGHSRSLPTLLSNLLLSCSRTGHISLRLVLFNTDQESWRETSFMVDALNQVKELLVDCQCASAEIRTFSTPPWKEAYGYDYTQMVLDDSLNGNGPEDYILFTNGDNTFNVGLFHGMLQHMDAGTDLAAFQFVSHYVLSGVQYKQMNVTFEPGRIDLSALFFRKQALKEARAAGAANFIPQGKQSWPFSMRDWYFVESMVKRNATKVVSPGVFLFHQ